MERKKEEFCNLTLGEMSIHEYVTEFNRLARYTQDEITTDARKKEGSVRDLAPSFAMISTSLNLPPLRI